jgi:transposase
MVVVENLERAQAVILALERENKILREELAILKQGLFGRRSERLEPGQLALFLAQPGAAASAPLPIAPDPAASRAKPSAGHGRTQFPAHLPREVIALDVPEAERTCPDCHIAMQPIGEDVTERGHVVPARIVVRRYVRKKYACPAGHAVKTAPGVEGVVEGAKYEPSVYAHVATAKYADHLPLHRLEGIFKRHGVELAKQTMWDMLVRVDELVAQPILAQMHKELLQEAVLHSDETPVTLRMEDGKGSRTGFAWGWRNLHGVGQSKVLIEFKTSRGRDGPLEFLRNWSGKLITDGYSGFDEVIRSNGIVRAGCWAHCRRKFKQALDAGQKQAALVLAPIQRLFALERAILERAKRQNLDREGIVALRQRVRELRAPKILSEIFARANELAMERSTLPKSALGKALKYLDRQRGPLSTFVSSPEIPIHNNDEERDLRHLAMGRNNWLVFASERGGQVACRLYSLVLSCKQAGVDPERYLEDMLGRVSTTKASDIASLTPWAWAAARN